MPTVNDNYPKKDNAEMSDAQLKELAIQQMQRQEVKNSGFPTEMISLPSQGKVYPETNPLSSGKIEMKYMTAREEDILTSQNLIRQGIVLEKLMQSMIVSPINYNDLVIGDKNAIMVAARILGYGKEYSATVECPKCTHENSINVDLTQLPEKTIPEDATMISPGVFEFTLPQSKRVIHFKLLNAGSDKQISKELEVAKKANRSSTAVDRELTTRLKNIIVSVDGETDKKFISNFVDNELFAMDSRSLRTYMKEISPDTTFAIYFTCSKCDHEEEALVFNIDTSFFWPQF
jgi:transcription elongation factor Elf1